MSNLTYLPDHFAVAIFPEWKGQYEPFIDDGIRNAILFADEIILCPYYEIPKGYPYFGKLHSSILEDFIDQAGIPCTYGVEEFKKEQFSTLTELEKIGLDLIEGNKTFTKDKEKLVRIYIAYLFDIIYFRSISKKGFESYCSDKGMKLPKATEFKEAIGMHRYFLRNDICATDLKQFVSQRCNAIMGCSIPPVEAKQWEPWQTVAELKSALQKICLPLLSNLPLNEIVEIRLSTNSLLSLVRAELLKLSKEVRKHFEAGLPEDFQKEAANVIHTEILPLVVEASSLLQDEMKKRYRKAFYSMTKYFSLLGLGVLMPNPIKLIPKIVDSAIDTSFALYDVSKDNLHPKSTVQFILGVNEMMTDR